MIAFIFFHFNIFLLSFQKLHRHFPQFAEPPFQHLAAAFHVARTVCRRAERGLTRLAASEAVNEQTGRYLNRLSDLLFILARAQSRADGSGEVYWNSRYSRAERD